MRHSVLLSVAVAAVTALVPAQQSITTSLVPTQGFNSTSTAFFRMRLNVPITITQVDTFPFTPGETTVSFYRTATTYVGKEMNASAWEPLGSVTQVFTAGRNTVVLPTPVTMQAGRHGFAICQTNVGIVFIAGLNRYSNAEMTLNTGSGKINCPGPGGLNNSLTWCGTIHYKANTRATMTARLAVPPNPLTLAGTNRPITGTTWTPAITNEPAGTLANFLLIGAGPVSVPISFGTLLCNPAPTLLIAPGVAGSPFSIPIARRRRFHGVGLCTQAVSVTATTVLMSNALDIVIGDV